jgi:ArsR family transcriptional regulator
MGSAAAPAILDHLAALADTTRSRLLLLLDHQELSVSELCSITQLPQSTVSRHLKALGDGGWIGSRAEGTSNVYRMTHGDLDGPSRRLWVLVREQVGTSAIAAEDQRRLQAILAERRTRSQEFFASAAGSWDRTRNELFGNRFHLAALVGFINRRWTVGDLGCGTGQLAAALAPFVSRVIGVDGSAAMLHAAQKRLRPFENVDLRRGELESIPIDDAELDAAVLMLVLHHVPDPGTVLVEAARTIKPRGRMLVVDMLPHTREAYRQQMGHVWLGFPEDQTRRMLSDAGLTEIQIVSLPPEAEAKGPGLFVATADKA